MQNSKLRFKIKNYPKILIIFLGIIFITSLGISIWLSQKNKLNSFDNSLNPILVKPVLAEEIYPLFFCPCCGQPLDKKNICCDAAKERINYIDSLADKNFSEKEIIISYVEKYGLNSFVDGNKAKELKEELLKAAPADRPIISLSPEVYDFGDVSQKAGKVFAYFVLENQGKSDLVIDRLETSCGCTFAAIVFKDKESPFFTMPGHGSENPSWGGVLIPPGEKAQLKVMYNPDVHKDFRGAATREIYVHSNDPVNFEKKVTVELNQVD